jgi:hypothetical protein
MHCSRTCPQSALGLGLIGALLLGGGCSSFHHEWKKAAANSPSVAGMQGRWQGSWHSDVNGHSGKLRCLISETGTNTYRARFHAKYLKILSFGYTVALKAEPSATNGFTFSGEANLGRLAGGVYHYEGHADGTNFFSTYSCKYDHGTFQMARP